MSRASIKIALDLTTIGPLHVGTGHGRGSTDRMMLRDHQSLPMISGSTIKGRVRFAAWRLCQWLDIPVCSDMVGDQRAAHTDRPDLVQRLFGTSRQRCTLRFGDAYLSTRPDEVKDEDNDYLREHAYGLRELRPGAARSRLLGTVSQGRLYSSEVATPDLVFHGPITGHLVCQRDSLVELVGHSGEVLFLWLALHLMMEEGLGGNKSAGCGRIRGQIGMRVNGASFQPPPVDDLADALEILRDEEKARP